MSSGPIFQATKQDVMGFLWGWSRLKKKITEYISRLIPRQRKRFLLKVPVTGDVVMHFEELIPVQGTKDFTSILFEILEDEDDE
ncbi:hypothetical protein MUP77_08155 [Candidatus Bathyarchaeota archaeon]|nr:hypothetical protein [Candidatus Bathyarchaeota archaeon]